MTVWQFFQISGAVIFGNLLTAAAIYAVWRIRRAERVFGVKDGADMVPWWVIWLLTPAPVLVGLAAWSLR